MMIVILKFKDRYITRRVNMTFEEIIEHYKGKVVSIRGENEPE